MVPPAIYDPLSWIVLAVGLAMVLTSTILYRPNFGGERSRKICMVVGPVAVLAAVLYMIFW
jgi:hypothetical protein